MKVGYKWFLSAFVLLSLIFTSTGCALINVNAQRDNEQVIATIDGKDMYKSDFNNALAMTQMNYEAGDQQWPTGSSLKTLKENLYDSLIQDKVFSLQADKDKLEIDTEKAKQTAQETLTQLQEELGNDQYENILKTNYTDNESFNKWVETNQIEIEKSNKLTEKYQEDFEKDPKEIQDQTVGKINDQDVTRASYEYRLLGEAISYYMANQTSLPRDEESMEETNKTIFENINDTDSNIKYCDENKIEIKQEDIDSQVETLKQRVSSFFTDEEQTKQLLENYYLTQDKYNELQTQQAKGIAAQDAIKQKCIDDVEVRDSEVQSYYNTHKTDYDTSEVSAMHILTEDKDAADSIYDEAKDITKKEDFQKLIDKYKDVEGVNEATDLGSFDRKTMVQEFSDAAFNADTNTVVGPVKTQFGYHTIFVYDHKDGETKSLDEVKEEITDNLKNEQGEEDYDKLEEDITGKAKYDIPDEIKTPLEEYSDKLEEEYHVTKNEKNIRA